MRFSATIIGKRDSGLIFTLDSRSRSATWCPEIFLCEGSGPHTIAARIVLDCGRASMLSLITRWNANGAVQSVATEPILIESGVPGSPVAGPHA